MPPLLLCKGPGVIAPYIMEDLAWGLRALGQEVHVIDLVQFSQDVRAQGRAAFDALLTRLAPLGAQYMVGYGATGYMRVDLPEGPQVVNDPLGVKTVLLWFDDPVFAMQNQFGLLPQDAVHFASDPFYEKQLQARGFTCHSLPLATRPDRFTSVVPEVDPLIRFVGSLPDPEVVAQIKKACSKDLADLLTQLERAALEDLTCNLDELVDQAVAHHPVSGFAEVFAQFKQTPDFWTFMYGAQAAVSGARRKGVIEALGARVKVAVTGDDRWKTVKNIRHDGPCVYGDPGPYAHALLTLDVPVAQLRSAVNQRVFDVPLCGGLPLTLPKPQLAELFPPGLMPTYATVAQAVDQWHWAQDHPKQRMECIEKARAHVLAHHTWKERAKILLEVCGQLG